MNNPIQVRLDYKKKKKKLKPIKFNQIKLKNSLTSSSFEPLTFVIEIIMTSYH